MANERKVPPVAWTEPPLTPKLPVIPILSPSPGQPEHAIILADRITGVVTHYLHSRTRPCTGDDATCEGCQLGKPKRWKGYLPGQTVVKAELVLIEITYEGYRGCREIQGVAAALRGKAITLTRAGKAKNSRVTVTIGNARDVGELREPFDVQEALCRIWFGERPGRTRQREDQFRAVVNKLVHQVGELPND